jgi:hypothetical protein
MSEDILENEITLTIVNHWKALDDGTHAAAELAAETLPSSACGATSIRAGINGHPVPLDGAGDISAASADWAAHGSLG